MTPHDVDNVNMSFERPYHHGNLRAALMAQKATAATGLMQDIDNWVATMPSDIGQPGWDSVQSSQFNSIVKNREDQGI